jgi:ATP-binding cassette subfamily B protein
MTEASPQSSRNAWRERVQALKNVPPVLGILWQSGPAVVTWGLVLRILVAALPAAIAYVAAHDHQRRAARFSHQGLRSLLLVAGGAGSRPQRGQRAADPRSRLQRQPAG